MVFLNLGKSNEGEDVFWNFPDNTSIIIKGLQGSGKSFLATMLLSQMRNRHQIVFDYEGEHYKRVRKSPISSKNGDWWLPTVYQCTNPYFTFQEMDRFDFESLQIAHGGSLILAELTKIKGNWLDIEKAIKSLPHKADQVNEFNERFGTQLNDKVNEQTKTSLVTKLDLLKEIFHKNGNSFHLPSILKYHHYAYIDFSFEGMNEALIGRARLFVGKFIEQIWDHCYKFSPVMVVEEAKILCPFETKENFKSLDRLNQFMLHQRRRTGSMLILITQDEKHLSPPMQDTYAFMIAHQFNDVHGRRWFTVGDNNYWKKGGKGRYKNFYVHDLEYI